MALLRLFGHPAMECGDSSRPLGVPAKTVALIALAAANASRPLPREWLAQQIWPDADTAQARANLRRHVHLALKALGDDTFLLGRQTIQWNGGGQTAADVIRFEALSKTDPAAALEEYAGEFCAGIDEESLDDLRIRYRSEYERLLRGLLETSKNAGDVSALRSYLRRLIAYDPFDEQAVRELMRLRCGSGDRAGAIRDYNALAQRLQAEMGVEPQPETLALFTEIAAENASPATPNNLVNATTTFVGRERELAEMSRALRESRVITLVGPGGIGKSRLATRCCFDLLHGFPDGVWFVDLEHARSEIEIWERIADAARLPASTARESVVLQHFRKRAALIVLDTCEHVVEAARDVAEGLLAQTQTRLVLTSRHRLRVRGELQIEVPAMQIPPERIVAGDSPLRYSAYRLFVERAVQVSPAFHVESAQISDLTALLRGIDGLPLGIELIASRANVLSIDGMRKRLRDAIRGARGFHHRGRARALSAVLQWSYDLLSERQRNIFAALSVFRSSFSVDDFEKVASGGANAVDVLFELVDASLVATISTGRDIRFRLLETTRNFAFEHLNDNGDLGRAFAAHAECFAEKADALATMPETQFPNILESLIDAMPDYLAAFERASECGWGAIGVRLLEGLYRFGMRGHCCAPICEHAKAVMRHPGISQAERARLARLAAVLDDNTPGLQLLQHAADYYREQGDEVRMCDALSGLAATYWKLGDHAECERLLLDVRERMERAGDTRVLLKALGRLGTLYTSGGKYEQALTVLPEVAERLLAIGEVRQATQNLKNLAATAYFAGRYRDALAWAQKTLELASTTSELGLQVNLLTLCGSAEQELGGMAAAIAWHLQACEVFPMLGECVEVAESLEDIAGTLTAMGAFPAAARLAGYAQRVREDLAFPLNPNERSAYDRMRARLEEGLGVSFAARWASGMEDDTVKASGLAKEELGRLLAFLEDNEDTTSLS